LLRAQREEKRCCDFLFHVNFRHESSARQVAGNIDRLDRNLSVGLAFSHYFLVCL
jgi:hypothetical protein